MGGRGEVYPFNSAVKVSASILMFYTDVRVIAPVSKAHGLSLTWATSACKQNEQNKTPIASSPEGAMGALELLALALTKLSDLATSDHRSVGRHNDQALFSLASELSDRIPPTRHAHGVQQCLGSHANSLVSGCADQMYLQVPNMSVHAKDCSCPSRNDRDSQTITTAGGFVNVRLFGHIRGSNSCRC